MARWQPYELALGQGPTLGDALGLGLGEIQAQRGVALNGGCGVCGPVASLGVRRDDRTSINSTAVPVTALRAPRESESSGFIATTKILATWKGRTGLVRYSRTGRLK